MSNAEAHAADVPGADGGPLCPLSLIVRPIARLLNFELADDPVYDGLELQWFDDDVHGAGMLAFLSRRADRRVDYYPQRGLRLDPAGYEIGGGIGSWTATDFDVARLEVAEDGIDAEVQFTDVDGHLIQVRIDDRNGRSRRRAQLLAPVSAGIDRPTALLLVWLDGFDLVRVTRTRPVIRIGGRAAATGRLPGAGLHRRQLIKYAAQVCAVELNRTHDGRLPTVDRGQDLELTADGSGVAAIAATPDPSAVSSRSCPRSTVGSRPSCVRLSSTAQTWAAYLMSCRRAGRAPRPGLSRPGAARCPRSARWRGRGGTLVCRDRRRPADGRHVVGDPQR